jgi:hypothetical protein
VAPLHGMHDACANVALRGTGSSHTRSATPSPPSRTWGRERGGGGGTLMSTTSAATTQQLGASSSAHHARRRRMANNSIVCLCAPGCEPSERRRRQTTALGRAQGAVAGRGAGRRRVAIGCEVAHAGGSVRVARRIQAGQVRWQTTRRRRSSPHQHPHRP